MNHVASERAPSDVVRNMLRLLRRVAGSDAGGERAALMYTLIESAKANGLDPEAYLRHVIARIADHPARRIAVYDELLARFGSATELPLREQVAKAESNRSELHKS